MDLISFEDLVVQPCNSYFNLEKELHEELKEVKSRLTLLEERLKYLEKPLKKKQPNKHVNQDTDLKYEISKKIQNDADRKIRLINRNKKREENEEIKLKRKEEWEKWDKEREEELERCNKEEETKDCLKSMNDYDKKIEIANKIISPKELYNKQNCKNQNELWKERIRHIKEVKKSFISGNTLYFDRNHFNWRLTKFTSKID